MSDPIKRQILSELDSRINKFRDFPEKSSSDNQYEELNQAISRVIGVPLKKELEDLRCFVEKL